ncbi:Uncharacterized protein SCG7086_AA_00280 [Chlamydiales bacterium SCGC AG-110-P3]|nr:Uncharacterized protein SCG7086_AA_00280 [Chlamydiales bacterium SCGC AG-110-P3]
MSEHPPFYGKVINRAGEQEYIHQLLEKYRGQPVSDDLKKQVWNELQNEKHLGNVTIPFKVTSRIDPSGQYPDCIEVILDSKV